MENARSMRFVAITAILTLFCFCHARPQYRSRLPNADAGRKSGLLCKMLGHYRCYPSKSTVNSFGQDFAEAGYSWTKEFCEKDSDGDGYSNGAELGDPCCEYPVETNIRKHDLSNPAEKSSVPKHMKHKYCR